eukprot:TRINITY_DN7323_c0_g2_i2.p2 TRINITY_DN7323_c0_g2~~TRINITY_DN7323_c0_g2_i2.p2  ORF type:complete len:202 (-),score=43.18 TRINITY_DN7323_c0_g2_i2:150-755(-)
MEMEAIDYQIQQWEEEEAMGLMPLRKRKRRPQRDADEEVAEDGEPVDIDGLSDDSYAEPLDELRPVEMLDELRPDRQRKPTEGASRDADEAHGRYRDRQPGGLGPRSAENDRRDRDFRDPRDPGEPDEGSSLAERSSNGHPGESPSKEGGRSADRQSRGIMLRSDERLEHDSPPPRPRTSAIQFLRQVSQVCVGRASLLSF